MSGSSAESTRKKKKEDKKNRKEEEAKAENNEDKKGNNETDITEGKKEKKIYIHSERKRGWKTDVERKKEKNLKRERERERENEERKWRGISERRDSVTVFSIFQRDGYRVKFNAISCYIIPIILSRVIAYWTYGRAFIFRPLVPASVGSVIALFRAR